jgi:hypothetical protein
MTVAFLVLAHQHPAQVARLAARLSGTEVQTLVHVDRRSDRIAFERMLPATAALLPEAESLPIYWGGLNIVCAVLSMLRRALKDPATGRITLLSGADYPAVSRDQLLDALRAPGQHIAIERRLSMTGTSSHDRCVNRYHVIDNWLTGPRSRRYVRHLADLATVVEHRPARCAARAGLRR